MGNKRKLPKSRNEVVFQLIKRAGAGAGIHGKSAKAQRAREKAQLKREARSASAPVQS